MMKTVCETDQCTGCMACVDICPKDAISIQDDLHAYNAVIDPQRCIDCDACKRVCQRHTSPMFHAPKVWYQGWASDENIRAAGSSGGIAGALTKAFLQKGGAVCSCVFDSGRFVFRITQDLGEAAKFSGSRYIKSDPSSIFPQILQLLKAQTPLLFIGLPCQCAGLQQYVGPNYRSGLYTADLICHGTPSPKVLDAFLRQYGMDATMLRQPRFRNKSFFSFSDTDRHFSSAQTRDPYTLAFLNTLCYTDNCYDCPYARLERVSDLTLGDSWGSALPQEQIRKGISLILCQTEKGEALLNETPLTLEPVDLHSAVACNRQLQEPSPRPACREAFFARLQQGARFNALVLKAFPRQYIRQKVKGLILKLKHLG